MTALFGVKNSFNDQKSENDQVKVRLILSDGTVYEGFSFGARKSVSGEVVFNTGMVGYPETMTDPSYCGQILVCTYPLIGNYGVPEEVAENGLLKNFESDKIHVSGLIVSSYSENYSHWDAALSLSDWMKSHAVPGIYGIDTRALTKKLRSFGTMLGKIVYDDDVPFYDQNKENLYDKVSVNEPVVYGKGDIKIMLVDCGCKFNIIRSFLKRGVQVIRVPWNYDFTDKEYDGLFISNGPGDPKTASDTISYLKEMLKRKDPRPIFGICLGNQILALAAGADTYKLKYGHRSQNQPCIEIGTKRCFITSQNHGFAVDTKSLKENWQPWFINANDSTNEGIRHKTLPYFSVQFHPEAKPGPVDTSFLFDRYISIIKRSKK